jgi:hypothetical protein
VVELEKIFLELLLLAFLLELLLFGLLCSQFFLRFELNLFFLLLLKVPLFFLFFSSGKINKLY